MSKVKTPTTASLRLCRIPSASISRISVPGWDSVFQYQLPVGPARVDFAFNPDRDSDRDEDFFVFHFSVGMAF